MLPPTGNDTAQIKSIASGECGLSLGNTYYYVRLLNSDDPADKAVTERVGVIFPNQDGRGTHVNISAAGVRRPVEEILGDSNHRWKRRVTVAAAGDGRALSQDEGR